MTSSLLTSRVGGLTDGRARKALWATYSVCATMLVAYLVVILSRPNGSYWTWLDGWGVDAFEIVLSLLCLGRAFVKRSGRLVALTLGIGLLSWTFGDISLTVESLGGATPPTPSVADIFYLFFYPVTYVGVVLLMRREIQRISPPSWLDGGVAGLGAAALCAAFAFHSIVHSTGGSALAVATNLAYPIGDVLLLSLIVAATTLLSGRGKKPWALLASGIALNVVGDTFNVFNSGAGTRIGNTFVATAWPAAILLISMAVWLRPRVVPGVVAEKTSGFLLPGVASAAAFSVLLFGTLHKIGNVAIGLSAATLVAAGIRLAISARGLKALTEERHKQAVTDELTGLGNRRKLHHIFENFFDGHDPDSDVKQSLAFLFVDLDHFKEINDSFGHPAGDELLRQLGPRLTSAVRVNDIVVRLGGDEFAVVLIDADAEEAKAVAERLAKSIEEPFALDMVKARIGASIGISILATDANDSAGLLRCADVAMFRAKTGNASFAFYDESLDDYNVLLLADELRLAVEERQFELHYQPQLDLRTGEITAVEALLRWHNPRLQTMIPPLKFLPVAEEAGLMPSLTALVLDKALAQCAQWHESNHKVSVSVNVSASNLLDPGFTEMVRRLVERHGLPPQALVLEITETCIISDYERSRKVIEDLRDLGLVVSIDDFGAGFTSLAYLGDLAVGELKLDRIFVTGLASEDRARDRALIRSTIELAHALRLRVVAEGIEDSPTLQLLADLRCDVAQGYYIGRPMPAENLDFATPTESLLQQEALVS